MRSGEYVNGGGPMSRASQGAPATRRARADDTADVGTPVKVDRLEGGSLLGIVRERTEYDQHDAPARVVVGGPETEANVSDHQVSVARGSNADLVRSLAGGESHD